MKYYKITARCEVKKMITVKGKSKEEAISQFEKGNWEDELEIDIYNWEMIDDPEIDYEG